MFHIVLHEPVIPQNTGSIARLCACTGAKLHLIEPLGFRIDEASVKRAGLDYWPFVGVESYPTWESFIQNERPAHLSFFSKKAQRHYAAAPLSKPPVHLVLGSETKGLPDNLWEKYPGLFYQVPMRTHLVRSLNLAQCAAIVLYEALRQQDFAGLELGSTLSPKDEAHGLPFESQSFL